jgi:hypothetical protein
MLASAVDHLIHNVLPAAADYETAEQELSRAYAADSTPAAWETAARLAKRRAAELAIATDGLADRCTKELRISKTAIRKAVDRRCVPRSDAFQRVRGVANAYKHADLSDPTLPITSEKDVLIVTLGYGIEAYGAGKFSGPEVIVRDKTGTLWKFLADAPAAADAWFKFLGSRGATLPAGRYKVCGLQVYP